jgi:gas vesicle protein
MAEEPDRIRTDIASTRAELTRDVDALADRTVPTRVARRRWSAVKEKVRGVSTKVMGTPSPPRHSRSATATVQDTARSAAGAVQDTATHAGEKASELAGNVADTVRQAPQAVAQQTQGNPIAAGLIAFGVGLLTASLIPTSQTEQRAAQQIKDNAGDLVEQVRQPLAESAQQLKEDLSGTVRHATDQVTDTAKEAAGTVTEQARSSAQDAADQSKQAARDTT